MNQKLEYLTDEELMLLIEEVEQKELVEAPPDLMEEILATVGGMEPDSVSVLPERKPQPIPVRKVSLEKRRKEYRAYCFRVITSVAAAIALVFLLPEAVSSVPKEPSAWETEITRGRYESKEEALGGSNFLTKKLGGTGWFEYANQWNIFEKINGGFNNETMQEK